MPHKPLHRQLRKCIECGYQAEVCYTSHKVWDSVNKKLRYDEGFTVREAVFCEACGWASKYMMRAKALTRVCPYCGMRSLKPQ